MAYIAKVTDKRMSHERNKKTPKFKTFLKIPDFRDDENTVMPSIQSNIQLSTLLQDPEKIKTLRWHIKLRLLFIYRTLMSLFLQNVKY